MKKFYTTFNYKMRNRRRSINAINKKKKRKDKLYVFISTNNKTDESKLSNTSPPVIPIKAPDDFSLINNTEATIRYFNSAQAELKKHNRILFDISHIKTLTTDAIAVQIAKIKDTSFHKNNGILGNGPNDKNLNKLFLQSGFYDYVNTNGQKPINNKKLLIHEITNNRVEPDIAKNACLLGLKHTFGNEYIFEPLYDILIEVMQNTNNHAGNTRGIYDWWLHVYNHEDSSKTSYTFLDLGVGIFESLPVQSYKRDFLELLGLSSNLDLVPKLFAGEIKSRTARPERGKGIPQVFECAQDKTFDKFILISNDIYADLKNKIYKRMSADFIGTLYYWEIANNNEILIENENEN
ncbi:MAG: hypothetical protein PSV18_10435 [Methylobacter sp.]|nr:hypothetical protein [Candidatus Methylobacter titanis]